MYVETKTVQIPDERVITRARIDSYVKPRGEFSRKVSWEFSKWIIRRIGSDVCVHMGTRDSQPFYSAAR